MKPFLKCCNAGLFPGSSQEPSSNRGASCQETETGRFCWDGDQVKHYRLTKLLVKVNEKYEDKSKIYTFGDKKKEKPR